MSVSLLKRLSLMAVIVFAATFSKAQESVVGYSFNDYPATVYSGKKARINFASNPDTYKAKDTKEQYQEGKVNFAGNYIIALHHVGTGLTAGVMIDARDGKIYNLPLSEENSVRSANGCEQQPDNENIFWQKDSKLFICYTTQNEVDEKTEEILGYNTFYYVYVWDEAKKKFELINDKIHHTLLCNK